MKRTTIGSVMRGICYGFAALLFATSCANDDVAQNEKQKKDNTPAGATVFTGTSQPETTTRTAILNHTKGAGASVNWSSTDKIWVKDDGGHWQQSGAVTFPFATNKAQGMFALSGTYTGATHDILYTNKAVSGTQPQVEIKATQTQSAPNNFDHAGESGDCGIAIGNKAGNDYGFTLNHKAAYLCFIPRSSNPCVNRSKLIKVEIMSDDDIAGTYDIAANGALTLASGGSKTITVTTGSGFAIDNSADDMSKNATYAVVAPGTHKFRIRYWLRNTTDNPDGPIEGTVSKIVTLNCTAGSINDITANLDPHYDGDHYYMWDAEKQFWEGHEWNKGGSQPTISQGLTGATSSNDYAQNSSDTNHRYYNEAPSPLQATHSCATLPNANEMSWYCMAGDPHWDTNELWTTMGHIYKGGMWFKKKSVLKAENNYDTEKSYDRLTDLRTTWKNYNNSSVSSDLPSVANAGNYFYLPTLGWYYSNDISHSCQLLGIGSNVGYWSSSADPSNNLYACSLSFSSVGVVVQVNNRHDGFRVGTFE